MFKTVVEYPELHVVVKERRCEEYRARIPGKAQSTAQASCALLMRAQTAFVLSFLPTLLIEMSTKHTRTAVRRRILALLKRLKSVIVQTHASFQGVTQSRPCS